MEPTDTGDIWTNALIEAVVTVVTSFAGASPVIGGALSGALAAVPPAVWSSCSGASWQSSRRRERAWAAGIGVFLLVGSGLLLAVSVGPGAVGEYFGAYLRQGDVL